MYTYSIIIPHRDTPQLLQRCLDSIPQRPDLEVIVVDDNSAPEIVDFDHFPGLKRSDTTVIFDKSGLGAGHARNIGLEHAQGKWLLFADADDFFTYCLNDVLDEYADCESDIIFFKASNVDCILYTNANRTKDRNEFLQSYEKSPDVAEQILRYVIGEPWAKLVTHSLVKTHQICFQETTIWNDTKFSYLTGYYAKSISADKRAIYCVTERTDSISYTINDEKILDRVKVAAERERFYLDHHLQFSQLRTPLNDLLLLKEKGRFSLYDKCLDAFAEFGFSHDTIEKMIADELQRRERAQRQIVIDKGIRKIRRIGSKLLRPCLRLLIK